MIQPIGFLIERLLRIKEQPAVIGYSWVALWLILSTRLYFSEMVESGFYDDPDGWVAVPILTRFYNPRKNSLMPTY
jgi:hypothetical protein